MPSLYSNTIEKKNLVGKADLLLSRRKQSSWQTDEYVVRQEREKNFFADVQECVTPFSAIRQKNSASDSLTDTTWASRDTPNFLYKTTVSVTGSLSRNTRPHRNSKERPSFTRMTRLNVTSYDVCDVISDTWCI